MLVPNVKYSFSGETLETLKLPFESVEYLSDFTRNLTCELKNTRDLNVEIWFPDEANEGPAPPPVNPFHIEKKFIFLPKSSYTIRVSRR